MLRLSLRRYLVRYPFLNRRPARHRNPNPIQSHPSICLRRRPLYCGSVPRICSRHTGIVFLRLDIPRESADDHRHGNQISGLRPKHTPLLISLPSTFFPVFFNIGIFILNYLYLYHHPFLFTATPHDQHRWCLINTRDRDLLLSIDIIIIISSFPFLVLLDSVFSHLFILSD